MLAVCVVFHVHFKAFYYTSLIAVSVHTKQSVTPCLHLSRVIHCIQNLTTARSAMNRPTVKYMQRQCYHRRQAYSPSLASAEKMLALV